MEAQPSLIRKRDSGTDERPRNGRSTRLSRIPDSLMRDAPRRLGFTALLYAGCYLTMHLVGMTSGLFAISGTSPWLARGVTTFSVVVSLGIFWISRSRRFSPQTLIDLGLVYQVVGAVGIDAHLMWRPIDPQVLPLGISWVGVWIVCFVAVVPASRGKTMVSALAAASVTPVLLLVGMARGTANPSGIAILAWCLPNYLCALLAFAVSRILYQLRSEVAEARQLGSYQLIEPLGKGGMGEVWRARHRMLARPAAIKLISPDLAGQSGQASSVLFRRFRQEAKATANLKSLHTITIYDYGVSDEGQFFYVMELLQGLDFDALVKRFGPLPAGRVVHLLHQACHSLGDAHAQGLIHRDVKPANIYCCRMGPDFDFVKVLDFGLLKDRRVDQTEMTALTQAGYATGTPTYMSPEIIRGDRIDGRSDIYSLGCVAFWLLTGRSVFQAGNPVEMMMQHLQKEPPSISQYAESEIPGALEEIVSACLAKQPDERPDSMEELSRRLAEIETPDVWDSFRARKWWGEHLPELAG